jgi:hypothetical protein
VIPTDRRSVEFVAAERIVDGKVTTLVAYHDRQHALLDLGPEK